LEDKSLCMSLKMLRHAIKRIRTGISEKHDMLISRNVRKDRGKGTRKSDLLRKNFYDIYRANIQRVKESLRSLEETSKLLDGHVSEEFKRLRFKVYEIEKQTAEKVGVLRDV